MDRTGFSAIFIFDVQRHLELVVLVLQYGDTQTPDRFWPGRRTRSSASRFPAGLQTRRNTCGRSLHLSDIARLLPIMVRAWIRHFNCTIFRQSFTPQISDGVHLLNEWVKQIFQNSVDFVLHKRSLSLYKQSACPFSGLS